MRVFTCADRWEDMASCIYDAWAWALTGGHDRLRLEKEPVLQATLFDEYVHIEPDAVKAEKVMRSVWHKISPEAYHLISYASLYREDMLDEIYRFLRLGFSAGGAGDGYADGSPCDAPDGSQPQCDQRDPLLSGIRPIRSDGRRRAGQPYRAQKSGGVSGLGALRGPDAFPVLDDDRRQAAPGPWCIPPMSPPTCGN